MVKRVSSTGYCPVQNKDVTIGIDYVHNFDCWEKGTVECEHVQFTTCPADHCPIIDSASSKLESI